MDFPTYDESAAFVMGAFVQRSRYSYEYEAGRLYGRLEVLGQYSTEPIGVHLTYFWGLTKCVSRSTPVWW